MTRKHMGGWAVWPAVLILAALPFMLGQGCPFGPGQETDPLTASAGPDRSLELGGSTVLQGSASGGSGVYTYSWSPTNRLSNASSATPTFTPDATGSFVLTLTVTDSLGAQVSDTVIVTVTEDSDSGAGGPLVAGAGPDLSVIVGSPITLEGTAAGGQSPYTFSWSPTTGLDDPTLLQPTFTPSQPGSTQFILTVTDAAGSTATDSTTITASTQTSLTSLTWAANFSGGGYQMTAVFNQDLNKASAETRSHYRVSGTSVNPTRATLASDNRTVTLTFEMALAMNSAIDFSVTNGLRDALGNRLPAFTAIPDINGSDTPATAPQLVADGVMWAADFADGYQVLITLNEAMDRASAETLSAYRVSGTSTIATSATLRGDGLTVEVVFEGVALSTGTTIDVSAGNVLQDINGNALVERANVTVRVNPLDTIRPNVVEAVALGGTASGFEVSIEFSEAMSKADVEKKEAYASSGSVLEEPISATLTGDGRTVILVFNTILAPTDRIRVGLGNLVKDINGRALNQVSVPFKTDTGDLTSPNAPALTWLNGSEAEGYQLRAVFREAMTATTVENVNHWRIQGTSTAPTSVDLNEVDLRTAIVTFDVPVNRDALIVVSVNHAIRDATGNALRQTSVPVSANAADIVSPQVATPPMWVVDYGSQAGETGYQLTLEFSETMDLKSAGSRTNYTLVRVDGSQPSKILQTISSPSRVDVDGEGRLVTLTFTTTSGGVRSSSDIRDRLRIASQVRDMNGRAIVSAQPFAIEANDEDAASPTVEQVKWSTLNNNRPYQVVVRFSEALDAATATDAGHYHILQDGVGPMVGPDELGLDEGIGPALSADGRSVTLTFSVDANTQFSPLNDTLVVAGGVTDINGNPTTGTGAGGQTIEQDPIRDTIPPKILEARWGEGPLLLDYRLIVTFSEGIDKDQLGTYTLSGSNAEGVPTLLAGGNRIEVVFDQSAYAAESTLTVEEIADMHGNVRLSNSAPTLANPLDEVAPSPLTATFSANYEGPGYQMTVVYDEVLDRVSATRANYYRMVTPGGMIQAAGFPNQPRIDSTGREVTLIIPGALALFTDLLELSLATSIKDVNGNAIPQMFGFVMPNASDNTPPTITEVEHDSDANPQTVTIEFSEVMDRATAENPGNYTWDDEALTIAGLLLRNNGTTVILELGPGQDASGQILEVAGVTDINGNPNEPCPSELCELAP